MQRPNRQVRGQRSAAPPPRPSAEATPPSTKPAAALIDDYPLVSGPPDRQMVLATTPGELATVSGIQYTALIDDYPLVSGPQDRILVFTTTDELAKDVGGRQDAALRQGSEDDFRAAEMERLQADYVAAQKAIMDMREVLKRRDETIAHKDLSLSQTKEKMSRMVPFAAAIHPTTRVDFDQIQVIKDLRQVVRLREQEIASNSAEVLQSRQQMSESGAFHAQQNALAEELQRQICALRAELDEAQQALMVTKRAAAREQMVLTDDLTQAQKKKHVQPI